MVHLAGITICYNDAIYIRQVIEAAKDHLDSFCIVEGAFRKTIEAGYPARSDDGTIRILADYEDDSKFEIEFHNSIYDPQQRQKVLELAKFRKADWVLIIDGDEVYDEKSLKNIRKLIESNPPHRAYKIPCRTFVNNFWTWHRGEMPRLFKITPESQFVGDNFIDSHHVPGTVSPDDICYFHYSYVREYKDFKCKFDHLCQNNPAFDRSRYTQRADGLYMVATDGAGFYPYDGAHPPIMWSHPKYTPHPEPNDLFREMNKRAGITWPQKPKWGIFQ